MKMKKSQLDKIILQEAQIASVDRINLNENLGETVANFGLQIIMQMIKTANGRKKLSHICYAIPNFIKNTICDMPEHIVEKIANKVDLSSSSMLRKIPGGLSTAFKYVCRLNITVLLVPMYVAGFILESLTDEDADVLVKNLNTPDSKAPTTSLPDSTDPVEPQPGEAEEDTLVSYAGAFLDEDELQNVLEEVIKRITSKK